MYLKIIALNIVNKEAIKGYEMAKNGNKEVFKFKIEEINEDDI